MKRSEIKYSTRKKLINIYKTAYLILWKSKGKHSCILNKESNSGGYKVEQNWPLNLVMKVNYQG